MRTRYIVLAICNFLAFSVFAKPPVVSDATVHGVVKKVLMNPQGELDGLLLEDGTEVQFPPHMSDALAATAKSGDSVSAEVEDKESGDLKAVSITNLGTNKTIVDQGPNPDEVRPPKHLGAMNLKAYSDEGKIESLLHGKNGEVNGVILSSGGLVRFPKPVADRFANLFQVGNSIAANGYGTQNKYGKCIEATAVGPMGQTPQPLYNLGKRSSK